MLSLVYDVPLIKLLCSSTLRSVFDLWTAICFGRFINDDFILFSSLLSFLFTCMLWSINLSIYRGLGGIVVKSWASGAGGPGSSPCQI